ncbi:MAG: tRNA uridine-5-carboxymethylaminomethyl(34) synthesis GTPase MnmE [Ruminococcus sp.]
MSTIAAIATPHAAGGISVIRISGTDALSVADRIFQSEHGKIPSQMKGYTCAYGRLAGLDDGIVTVFRAPHSYTGEDVAEFSCHGGIYMTQQILDAVLHAGAVPAEAGEFTRRAFCNGKLSLTQAEAVMDVISASGSRELQFANAMRDGAMVRRVQAVQAQLVTVLSGLAAWADYPEEDLPEVSPESLQASLSQIQQDLQALLKTKDYGRILKSGVSTVIAGKPNVGKSTLFNLLSGCERSIVTEIAGTTRDVVEECVRLGEVTLRLSDTAGLRDTADVIEQIGVRIAKEKLEQADLILAVFDSREPLSAEDLALLEQLKGRQVIVILNKSDAGEAKILPEQLAAFPHCITMSAKEGSGLDALQEAVTALFYRGDVTPELGILANARQAACAETALEMVTAAMQALQDGELLDAVTVLLDEAAQALMTLTGERVTEAVVDEVFRHFCVGK